jgi:hypothetical protein
MPVHIQPVKKKLKREPGIKLNNQIYEVPHGDSVQKLKVPIFRRLSKICFEYAQNILS